MHYLFVLLALGALLIVHELGHLVAARLLGVRVPRFTVGFGPPLLSFRLGGTQFVLGAVPLGASANLQGMNPHRSAEEDTSGFGTLGPLKRMAIILAGPLANYAVALGLLFALYSSGTHVVVPLTVGTVLPGSEAARAQLLPGDKLVAVAGKPLESWSDFVARVADGVGGPLELSVERHGEPRKVTVRPRADERGAGRIGVSQQYVFRTHAPGEAFTQSLVHTGRVASEALSTLVAMVRGPEVAGKAGPGALMRQESSDVASSTASGADALVRALVAASVALAMLTMVPVPGLDGGRVLLLAIEAVSGRRIPPRVETVAQTAGFLFLSIGIVATAGAEIRRALPSREEPPAGVKPPSAAPVAAPAPVVLDAGVVAVTSPAPVAPKPAAVAPVIPDAGTLAAVKPDAGTALSAAVKPDAGTVSVAARPDAGTSVSAVAPLDAGTPVQPARVVTPSPP
ncbi:M50A family peptidase [Corallococcus coralloides DSM 2259]|uniref:M50A family peptidase n=1 Tax=Corallococcus coralloides (strain ATCC 25202 / DSM 2259 / NBRC 100086 / M2) TaxID=1144275 RepID=H8MZ87_CORCM|nr:M50 family metallopeptidase [Corallococcus coralloides]AFE10684.1 M50A family peptidase [Corallococcus coralloides DSM 2259]